MKKIISYSLWGTNEFYTFGAVENILDAKKYFPDFTCRFYVDPNVPYIVKNYIKENAEYIEIDKNLRDIGRFCVRFLPFFEEDVDIFLSRDADSRLTEREAKIIDKWINEEKTGFLALYEAGGRGDNCLIDGGMFACNNNFFRKELNNIKHSSLKYFRKAGNSRNTDRTYLNNSILPIVKKSFTGFANFKIYSTYHKHTTYERLLKHDIELKDMPYDIELDEGSWPRDRWQAIGDSIYNIRRAYNLFNMKFKLPNKKKRHNQIILLVNCVSNEFNDKIIELYWKRLINKIKNSKNYNKNFVVFFLYGNSFNGISGLSNEDIIRTDFDDSKKYSSTQKLIHALRHIEKQYNISNILKLEMNNFIHLDRLLEYSFNLDRNQEIVLYGDLINNSNLNFNPEEGYLFNKDSYDKILKPIENINISRSNNIKVNALLKNYPKNQIKNYKINEINYNLDKEIQEIKENNHFLISINKEYLKNENLTKIEKLINNFV